MLVQFLENGNLNQILSEIIFILTLFESIVFSVHVYNNHYILRIFKYFTMVHKIAYNLVNINIKNIKVSMLLNITKLYKSQNIS